MSGEHDAVAERGLWNGLPVALFRTTADGCILDVNPAFVDCFRAPSRESLLRIRAEDLYVNAEDRARGAEALHSRDVVHGFEAQMRRLDGTTFWARGTVRAERAPSGEVIACQGSVEDIGLLSVKVLSELRRSSAARRPS